jgi:hypothetical protein
MQGAATVKPKQTCDIEKLLWWTYLHELPKRKISSAEGIWDRLSQYGSLGGINPDPGHGAAQRYPHFGLPHPDAELIEKAVAALQPVAIDWNQHANLLLWDLAPLVSLNELKPLAEETIWTSALVKPGKDGRGISASPHKPRDMLLVQTINVEMLVYSHAIKGTRPNGWRANDMRAVPTAAERGPLAKIIGICKGKNSYSSGSYCPLRWEPSPVKVVMARANFFAWHQALTQLANELALEEHQALPPHPASATPWAWLDTPQLKTFYRSPPIRSRPLPLKPTRKRAGPKYSRKRKRAA